MISTTAFEDCHKLTEAIFPSVISLFSAAFSRCSGLVTVSFPMVSSLYSDTFAYCISLENISFPELKIIGWRNNFTGCYALKSIYLPKCEKIEAENFYNCSGLSTVILPLVSSIGTSCFYGCSNLKSLYLFGSTVVPYAISMMTYAAPSIYVRASLLTAYKTAASWSNISNRIIGMTDAQIETFLGGLS